MRCERAVDIDAEPSRVWAVLSDVERWPEWSESMTTVERTDTGPFRVGSTVTIKQPRLRPADFEVTALEPGRRFTWVSKAPGLTSEGDHVVEPRTGGGTRATLVLRQTGPAAPLVALLFGGLIRRYVEMEAEGLKRRSEAS